MQKYKKKQTTAVAQTKNKISKPGMKTRYESRKLAKEGERIQRFKNKPTKRKLADHDLPEFKKGKNWRV